MLIFKKISDFFYLNQLKESLYRSDQKGLSEEEINDLNKTKPQNPFGVIALIAGGASFTFGMTHLVIPLLTMIYCLLTYGTFDKEKEDNPWVFYLGFSLTLIGLAVNLSGVDFQIVI